MPGPVAEPTPCSCGGPESQRGKCCSHLSTLAYSNRILNLSLNPQKNAAFTPHQISFSQQMAAITEIYSRSNCREQPTDYGVFHPN